METPPVIPLEQHQLTLPKENTYFTLLLIVSILLWIAIAISVIGIPYALLVGLAAWMASGLLAARLKSESVEVTPEQLPALHAVHQDVCTKLGLSEVPAFYLLQANGILNAFAMRHSGRNFVVIYSNLLEALGHDSPQVRFLIGHEIGHIKRGHILKRLLLLPSLIVPLLGKAYHRACEATCDRFGYFAAGGIEGATHGLLVLAGGKEAAPLLNPGAFARQYYTNRGFFVSWHDLAANYPTLSQRVAKILGITDSGFSRSAPRNPLAYLFAPLFTLQALVILYCVIIFGAMALPAIKQAKAAAQRAQIIRKQNQSHNDLFAPPTPPAQ